jgi:hypothetical protein
MNNREQFGSSRDRIAGMRSGQVVGSTSGNRGGGVGMYGSCGRVLAQRGHGWSEASSGGPSSRKEYIYQRSKERTGRNRMEARHHSMIHPRIQTTFTDITRQRKRPTALQQI